MSRKYFKRLLCRQYKKLDFMDTFIILVLIMNVEKEQ